ncbi:MAG: hypothetical protein ACRYFS_24775 [Janthinobacterium lividum]
MIDREIGKKLFWWTLYASAFGYVEALVVVYIRRLGGMPPGLDYPAIWASRHLVWSGAGVIAEMRRIGVYETEYTREIATLLLLLGPACAAGRNWRERIGLYLFTFAVWDETFYLWLKLWTGFPQSLGSTDIYFLVPIAWFGPVWFPVLVVMPALIWTSLRLLASSLQSAYAPLPQRVSAETMPPRNRADQESALGANEDAA